MTDNTRQHLGTYPEYHHLQGFAKQYHDHIRDIITNDFLNLHEKHNAYTEYIISLLFHATGHRPVIDPFCYLHEIDHTNGWCLINDKVISEERRYRLAPFPDIAITQLNHYLKYLAWLSRHLYSNKGNDMSQQVGMHIQQLLQANSKPAIPLFFYINKTLDKTRSISSHDIDRSWEAFTPLPANIGRRILATELFNIPADFIEIMLGHISSPEHPFGRCSTHAPAKIMAQLNPAIDSLLNDIGWKSIGWPLAKTVIDPAAVTISKSLKLVHLSDILGPEYRYQTRLAKHQREKEIVRVALEHVFDKDIPKHIKKADIDALESKVIGFTSDTELSKNRSLKLLYRFLTRLHYQGYRVDLKHRRTIVVHEASPFREDTVSTYLSLQLARDRFNTHLDNAGKSDPQLNTTTRIAEIIVSAALYGGTPNKTLLKNLGLYLSTSCWQISGILCIDIPDSSKDSDKSTYSRLNPDPLTSSLLHGLARDNPFPELTTIPWQQIKQHIKLITNIVLPKSEQKQSNLDRLVDLSRVGLLIEQPGYIRGAMNGETPYTSLPQHALVRMFSGRKADLPASDDIQDTQHPAVNWTPDLDQIPTTSFSTKNYLFKLNKWAREVLSKVPTGYKNRKAALKRKYAKKIKDKYQKHTGNSQVAKLIIAWTVHLCRHGTRGKTDIAFKTVRDYTTMVAKPLLEIAKDTDFINLSEIEYEALYLRALEYSSHEDKSKLAGKLREFHYFLMDNWACEDPDWLAIGINVSKKDRMADANLLSPLEYERALKRILGSPHYNERLRHQHAALLILGYRFNLRFGEAYRIEYREIQYLPDLSEIFIQISNNVYGEVKTLAGVRQIPLIGQLSEIERQVLRRILNTSEEQFMNDPLAGIMTDSVNSRILIDRATATRHINETLRHVTGDPKFRYHHCRRSWNMRIVCLMETPHTDPVWEKARNQMAPNTYHGFEEYLWGMHEEDYRPLKAIATVIGHANESTTLSGYTHIVEFMTNAFRYAASEKLTRRAMAYALQLNIPAINKRRTRFGKQLANLLSAEKTHLLFPTSQVKTTTYVTDIYDSEKAKSNITPTQIDNILSLVSLRSGSTQGVAEKLSVSDHDICMIMNQARIVEQDSGFELYRSSLTSNDPLHTNAGKLLPPHNQNLRATQRVQQFLYETEKSSDLQSSGALLILKSGLEAWAHAHSPSNKYVVFSNTNKLSLFLQSLDYIKSQEVKIQAIVRNEASTQSLVSILDKHNNIEIVKSSDIPRSHDKMKFHKESRVAINISELPSNIGTRECLFRILYVLFVWVEVQLEQKIK